MVIHYAMAKFPEVHAKAMAKDLPISTKHCVEICKYLKGKKLQKAKQVLSNVMAMKQAIPYTRSTLDLGHKKGIGPGRYPVKASEAILTLLNSVDANAQLKGLNSNDLIIEHIAAQQASRPWHYGRKGRAKMKRSHVEVVVIEKKAEEAPKQKSTEKKNKDDIQSDNQN